MHKQHQHFGPRGRRGRGGFGPYGPGGFSPTGDEFGPEPGQRRMRPEGPRRGPGGFGPGGFGPGGFGPGGFGPGGFGPGGFGPGGFGPGKGAGRRGRRGRGNVRFAVLALLTEGPRHGYALMSELTERSGGLWRPSPGSVYPVLSQLEDEGLIEALAEEGRRVYRLTKAGQEYVAEHSDDLNEPWRMNADEPANRIRSLMQAGSALAGAVQQVARTGTQEQADKAIEVLTTARTAIYRILAELPADVPSSNTASNHAGSENLTHEPSSQESGSDDEE